MMLAQSTASLAQDIGSWMWTLFVPFMLLLLVGAFLMTLRLVASRYKKVPPNAVLIVYGRKSGGKGFRIVSGGGSLVYPIIEAYQEMSTGAFQVEINEEAIPNKDNVPVNVRGVASCKIGTSDEELSNAAQAFLGQSEERIHAFVANILLGHLRSIIGKLGIGDILRSRDVFNKQVIDESTEELRRLGIVVITLVVQDVNDTLGYIEALGKQAVAEAIRDADIKVAEAKAYTTTNVSNAQRDADITVAQNAARVAEAQKNRDVQAAQYKVLADTAIAEANTALAIATASQEQTLKVAEAQRDAAQKEAQIAVQQKEAQRKEQELEATVVRPAQAEKRRKILEAEADAEVLRKRAEGTKQARTLEGEGEAARMTAEAKGQAAMKRDVLLAEAEGEAAKKKLALLGEAEGTAKMAEALEKMSESARLLLILDRMPTLLDNGGDALSKVARAVFESVAAPLAKIGDVRIVDIGGNGNGISQFGTIVPTTVFKFLSTLAAEGIQIEPLLRRFGISVEDITKMVSANGNGVSKAPVAPANVAEVADNRKEADKAPARTGSE